MTRGGVPRWLAGDGRQDEFPEPTITPVLTAGYTLAVVVVSGAAGLVCGFLLGVSL